VRKNLNLKKYISYKQMSENTNEEELNSRIKKSFITNSIFGQKLINNLSQDKKKEINIDYFFKHIKNLNLQKNENYEKKIDYKKYIDSIPQNIHDKLSNESEIVLKTKNSIEPYCKKQIKINSPINTFKKNGFHFKLVKLESKHFDLFHVIYLNDKICGYVCCGKKNMTIYKNLYIVISSKYESEFFEKQNKKLSIINEITEEICFFEKETYQKYIKYIRNQLYTFILEILNENKSIKNIILIGEEEGGNFLQLFLVDFISNKSEVVIKIPDELSFYLFTYNTAMLSTETFYNDMVDFLGENNNSVITSFDEKNNAFNTWDINLDKKNKFNIIITNEK